MVDPEFGTGAVKITPAHDPDDYELGKRHHLPAISILDDEARINENGGELAGLDRYAARRTIVERLREMGDLESEEPHQMVVGHCQRCDTVVEPRLSVQWFVHVKPLAERALASVREGRTRIVPNRFVGRITEYSLGAAVPTGDRAVQVHADDAVVRGIHDGGQQQFRGRGGGTPA